jgi:hypothetical protein
MRPLLSTEQLVHAAALWKQGLSSKEIAHKLGITDKQFQCQRDRKRHLFPKNRRETKCRMFVYLTPETHKKLGQAAINKGMNRSAYIRYLIEREG